MGLFKKKNKNEQLLKTFDGREVKYVTKRVERNDGTINYDIIGKAGRIAVLFVALLMFLYVLLMTQSIIYL